MSNTTTPIRRTWAGTGLPMDTEVAIVAATADDDTEQADEDGDRDE